MHAVQVQEAHTLPSEGGLHTEFQSLPLFLSSSISLLVFIKELNLKQNWKCFVFFLAPNKRSANSMCSTSPPG